MKLEPRNTPLGRMLVVVDPEASDAEERIAGVSLTPGHDPDIPDSALPEETVLDAMRSVFRRFAPNAGATAEQPGDHARQEAQDLMNKADALVDDLFAEYFRRVESVTPAPGPDAKTASVATTDMEEANDRDA